MISVVQTPVTFDASINSHLPMLPDSAEKAAHFKQLHHGENLLLLPNIWDPIGAALLEQLGYPAVATASASMAYTNGYHDGEQMPFDQLLVLLKRITSSVNIPVSADVEHGYSTHPADLRENIKRLLDTGIAGINFEDSRPGFPGLVPMEVQSDLIHTIRRTADEQGIPLFINARTDVFLQAGHTPDQRSGVEETIRRGCAFQEAGADGFYPILLRHQEALEQVAQAVSLPINLFAMSGIPEQKQLTVCGVARLSLGPGFLKIALKAMRDLAIELQQGSGLEAVLTNDLSSDFVKSLIRQQP
jgi:2-methylisocitrate lyase-like PEP mutase family enzyme